MSKIKIFVEPEDGETWDDICYKVSIGTITKIDFRGILFEKVKHGHWFQMMGHAYCSVCGYKGSPIITNYCPNCGAKMDEVK